MKFSILRFVLLILVWAFLLSPASAAGPVRSWIKAHRPGVLIPKRIAPSVISGTTSACPCPNCPNCPAAVATAPVAPKALPAVLPVSPPVRQFVPSVNPQTVRYEYRQVCDGGRCRLILVPVP